MNLVLANGLEMQLLGLKSTGMKLYHNTSFLLNQTLPPADFSQTAEIIARRAARAQAPSDKAIGRLYRTPVKHSEWMLRFSKFKIYPIKHLPPRGEV